MAAAAPWAFTELTDRAALSELLPLIVAAPAAGARPGTASVVTVAATSIRFRIRIRKNTPPDLINVRLHSDDSAPLAEFIRELIIEGKPADSAR
jgi:hypothetical protein